MNFAIPRVFRRFAKPVVEAALPWAEQISGFRTASGDYLPNRLRILIRRYEAEELRLIHAFVHPGQSIADVGANVGYTTRFFARLVGDSGKVFAFEPNPSIFELLEQNLKGQVNVATHNLGLSSRNGDASLFLAGLNSSVASLSQAYPATHLAYMENGAASTIRVRLVRGDDFLSQHGVTRLDLLKIDVEGFELDALGGLEETIERSNELIVFCEFNPLAQKCAGHEPPELLDWFFARNFTLQFPNDGKLDPLMPAEMNGFIERTAQRSHTTLFATRK